MTDAQFMRSLISIGLMCFVKYLELFRDGRISREDAIGFLMRAENYKESGCITRVYNARRIIREGRLSDALTIISKAKKIDSKWSDKAKNALESL